MKYKKENMRQDMRLSECKRNIIQMSEMKNDHSIGC